MLFKLTVDRNCPYWQKNHSAGAWAIVHIVSVVRKLSWLSFYSVWDLSPQDSAAYISGGSFVFSKETSAETSSQIRLKCSV